MAPDRSLPRPFVPLPNLFQRALLGVRSGAAARARHVGRQSLGRHRAGRGHGDRLLFLGDGPAASRPGNGRQVHQPPSVRIDLDIALRPAHRAARARPAAARVGPTSAGVSRGCARHRQALEGSPLARRLRDGVHETRASYQEPDRAVRVSARRLLDAGHRVIGIDPRGWPGAPAEIELHAVDIRKRAAEDVFRRHRPDAVIHMATISALLADAEERYRINLGGTRAVFEHCANYGVRQLVFVGRHTYYGAGPDAPLYHTEAEPPQELGAYPELADLVAADLYAANALWRLMGRAGLPRLSRGALAHINYPIVVDASLFRRETGFQHRFDELITVHTFADAVPPSGRSSPVPALG